MDKTIHTGSTVVLLGRRIKELRKERKITQDKLAEDVGASLNTISSIERGIRSPSIEILDKISRALDVPIKDVFDFFPNQELVESPAREEIVRLVRMLREQPPRKVRSITEITQLILHKFK